MYGSVCQHVVAPAKPVDARTQGQSGNQRLLELPLQRLEARHGRHQQPRSARFLGDLSEYVVFVEVMPDEPIFQVGRLDTEQSRQCALIPERDPVCTGSRQRQGSRVRTVQLVVWPAIEVLALAGVNLPGAAASATPRAKNARIVPTAQAVLAGLRLTSGGRSHGGSAALTDGGDVGVARPNRARRRMRGQESLPAEQPVQESHDRPTESGFAGEASILPVRRPHPVRNEQVVASGVSVASHYV